MASSGTPTTPPGATEGDYGSANALTTTTLAGFIPRSWKSGVSYRGSRFNVSVQANRNSDYLISNSANAALVTYRMPRMTWNFKSRFALRDELGIFFDVENVSSEPQDETYLVYPERNAAWRSFYAKITAGISGKF